MSANGQGPGRDRPFLGTRQASFYLGVSARYLQQLRKSGKGPAFRQHSRLVLYHIDDLDAWSLATRRSRQDDRGEGDA
ncbi:MAG TPA: helix-turn-helix domain-containing protein [Novosphingobium sp.]|nr:helix-turn-helix domain-containing protein [Novosphingobium sp.]